MPARGTFQLLAGRQDLKSSGILRPTFDVRERAALPLFNALTWDKCAFKIWQGGVLEIAGLGAAAMGFEKTNNRGLPFLLNKSHACPISPRGAEHAKGRRGAGAEAPPGTPPVARSGALGDAPQLLPRRRGLRLECSPCFSARRLGAGRSQPHPLPRPHILPASVRPAFPRERHGREQ